MQTFIESVTGESCLAAKPISFFAKVMGIFSGLMRKACKKAITKDLADLKTGSESENS